MKVHKIAAWSISLIVTIFMACNNQKSEKKETSETDTTVIKKVNDTTATADHTATNDQAPPNENTSPNDKVGGYSFTYSFTDASTAPQYHRSYMIKVSSGQVTLTVTSYQDVLLNSSTPLSESAYDNFTQGISKLNIRSTKETTNPGCTGGTSEKLDLFSGSPLHVSGEISDCGGKKYGNLEGNTSAAILLFKNLVPDLAKKIDGTRK